MTEPLRISLIGARGQMGRFFMDAFRKKGMHVTPLNRPLVPEIIEKPLQKADIVLLSVPIMAMDTVLESIGKFLQPPVILADVSSVKVLPVKKMLSSYNGPVVGTHPLFGPAPSSEDNLKTAICAGRDKNAVKTVSSLFERIGCSTFLTTAEEHDRAMAYIQGLNFVTNISYFSCLPQDMDIERFFTPSFKRRVASAGKMVTEDAELFSALFEQNPFSGESIRGFRSFLNIAAGGDLELISEKALWWWRNNTTKDDKQ